VQAYPGLRVNPLVARVSRAGRAWRARFNPTRLLGCPDGCLGAGGASTYPASHAMLFGCSSAIPSCREVEVTLSKSTTATARTGRLKDTTRRTGPFGAFASLTGGWEWLGAAMTFCAPQNAADGWTSRRQRAISRVLQATLHPCHPGLQEPPQLRARLPSRDAPFLLRVDIRPVLPYPGVAASFAILAAPTYPRTKRAVVFTMARFFPQPPSGVARSVR
jgi:hypothetical protein